MVMNYKRIYFSFSVLLAAIVFCLPASIALSAQQYNESQFKGMKWRGIGPYRGGRVLAVSGVPGDPYTFYFGGVAGGGWRARDGGGKLDPLFEKENNLSVGAIAGADSKPNVSFVCTGE